jgi:hypothetical protein
MPFGLERQDNPPLEAGNNQHQPPSKSYPSIKHRHSARVTYPNKNQYEKAESEYVTRDFS